MLLWITIPPRLGQKRLGSAAGVCSWVTVLGSSCLRFCSLYSYYLVLFMFRRGPQTTKSFATRPRGCEGVAWTLLLMDMMDPRLHLSESLEGFNSPGITNKPKSPIKEAQPFLPPHSIWWFGAELVGWMAKRGSFPICPQGFRGSIPNPKPEPKPPINRLPKFCPR